MTPRFSLAVLTALSLAAVPALAETKAAPHDHSHTHSHAADDIYKGIFDDAQIQPRTLADWQGDWQSVYPLLASGVLDPVMAKKAEKGDKTAAEYRAYYDTGYKTDVNRIEIKGDRFTFHREGGAVSATYGDDGHEVLTYEKGNRGVRYSFKKLSGDAAAPQFVQFSDHHIAPEKVGHFHLYWGDDRAKVLAELTNWPTYYPAALTPDQVAAEMLAH